MVKYTQEQIEQMFAESRRLREEIRKHHVSTLLENLNLKGGEIIEFNGRNYKVLSYDELCDCNVLGTNFMYLCARPIKKDGTPSNDIRKIPALSGMSPHAEFKVIAQ